jgi:hypothetical protein
MFHYPVKLVFDIAHNDDIPFMEYHSVNNYINRMKEGRVAD